MIVGSFRPARSGVDEYLALSAGAGGGELRLSAFPPLRREDFGTGGGTRQPKVFGAE